MTDASRKSELRAALERLGHSPRDQEAWSVLYNILWPYAFTIAYRRLGGRSAEAEDCAQEAFLRLVRYAPLDDLQDPGDFRRYLSRLVANVTNDHIRRDVREAKTLVDLARENPRHVSDFASSLLEIEVVELLEKMLADASPSDRDLAKLLALDYPRDEIARILGLSYENTNVRIHRLRKKFRDHASWDELRQLLGAL